MRHSKIIILTVIITILAVLLCSCGNMSMGMGSYTFEHVHFSDAVEGKCATVEKWYDNETGIEVKTKEYGAMYLSEGSYQLIADSSNCPYCK
jgi:hypothetical protein